MSEMIAGVAKICSNADLIYGGKKMPVIKKANTTIGLPGTFSCRLQPNDTRDDVQSIAAQIYEGLSFGAGDAVIGVNPVTDDVENLSRVLDTVYGVIDKFNIPTQGCVLAHVTTQIEAIRRGAPGGLIFQSICGSEKGLKEFGVELAMLDEARAVGAEFNRIAGENCLYFETGQGSALSAGANFGADQVIWRDTQRPTQRLTEGHRTHAAALDPVAQRQSGDFNLWQLRHGLIIRGRPA